MTIGVPELLIVLVVILLILGPKRLPALGPLARAAGCASSRTRSLAARRTTSDDGLPPRRRDEPEPLDGEVVRESRR